MVIGLNPVSKLCLPVMHLKRYYILRKKKAARAFFGLKVRFLIGKIKALS